MYQIKMKSAKKSDMALEEGCCLNGRLPQIKINVVPSKENLVKRIQGSICISPFGVATSHPNDAFCVGMK